MYIVLCFCLHISSKCTIKNNIPKCAANKKRKRNVALNYVLPSCHKHTFKNTDPI